MEDVRNVIVWPREKENSNSLLIDLIVSSAYFGDKAGIKRDSNYIMLRFGEPCSEEYLNYLMSQYEDVIFDCNTR
ncbi:MAG TPA: hypothetical protein VMC07_01695 [Candidatus Omnitrophota bacterium]|nr:hypothetical protein [Candidatus Omnitrophota bacterium]